MERNIRMQFSRLPVFIFSLLPYSHFEPPDVG